MESAPCATRLRGLPRFRAWLAGGNYFYGKLLIVWGAGVPFLIILAAVFLSVEQTRTQAGSPHPLQTGTFILGCIVSVGLLTGLNFHQWIGARHQRTLVAALQSGHRAAQISQERFKEACGIETQTLDVTLKTIADGVIIADETGRLLQMNSAAEKLSGYSQSQAVGLSLGSICHLLDADTRRNCDAEVRRMITGPCASRQPRIMVAADGKEQLVEMTVTQIGNRPTQPKRILVILRHEQARAEGEIPDSKSEESLERLRLATGNITHDLNNSLTGILGNVSLALISRGLTPQLSERLTTAKTAGLHAQRLVQQLQSLVKCNVPVKEVTSIEELLRSAMTHCYPDAVISADPALWRAELDAEQIREAFEHLAREAQGSAPANGPLQIYCENLTLSSAARGLSAGVYVKIRFEGQRLAPAESDFDTSSQQKLLKNLKADSIGLARAHAILNAHGGRIETLSGPDGRTIYEMFLAASTPAALTTSDSDSPKRILVLDDDEALCELLSCALEPLGYQVTETHDGADAVTLYAQAFLQGHPFHLVITDLSIPGGLGGEETVRQLQKIDPKVRAIVCSGSAADPIVEKYREYGFCGVLRKPYEITTLGQIISEASASPASTNVIKHDFAA